MSFRQLKPWLTSSLLLLSLFGNKAIAESPALLAKFCQEVERISLLPNSAAKETAWGTLKQDLEKWGIEIGSVEMKAPVASPCESQFSDDMERLEFVLGGLQRIPADSHHPEIISPVVESRTLVRLEGFEVAASPIEEGPSGKPVRLDARRALYQKLFHDLAERLHEKVLSFHSAAR